MIEGTSGSTETLCVENDPFTITAPEFSSLEGCFVATNQTVQGETVYSTTGVYEAGAVMVDAYRFFLDEREVSSSATKLAIGNVLAPVVSPLLV